MKTTILKDKLAGVMVTDRLDKYSLFHTKAFIAISCCHFFQFTKTHIKHNFSNLQKKGSVG